MAESIDERAARIYNYYHQDGLSYAAIGRKEKLSRERVRQIIEAFNQHEARSLSEAHQKRFSKFEFDPTLREVLLDLVNNFKLTPEAIAEQTDRSIEEIIFHLDYSDEVKHVITIAEPEILSNEDKKIIKDYFDKEEMIEDLAETYNKSETEIIGILKTTGKKLRTKTENRRITKTKAGKFVTEEQALEAVELKNTGQSTYAAYARDNGLSYQTLMRKIYEVTVLEED